MDYGTIIDCYRSSKLKTRVDDKLIDTNSF